LGEFDVSSDGNFTVINGGDKFPADTTFTISNTAETTLQQLTIHTSCSQPLDVGNIFGSLKVLAFDIVPQAGSVPCEPNEPRRCVR
jgi:hypothetical protein